MAYFVFVFARDNEYYYIERKRIACQEDSDTEEDDYNYVETKTKTYLTRDHAEYRERNPFSWLNKPGSDISTVLIKKETDTYDWLLEFLVRAKKHGLDKVRSPPFHKPKLTVAQKSVVCELMTHTNTVQDLATFLERIKERRNMDAATRLCYNNIQDAIQEKCFRCGGIVNSGRCGDFYDTKSHADELWGGWDYDVVCQSEKYCKHKQPCPICLRVPHIPHVMKYDIVPIAWTDKDHADDDQCHAERDRCGYLISSS